MPVSRSRPSSSAVPGGGIPVRDLYPIARSATESFINAAYLLSEAEEVALRAVRWVKYRAWKEHNRIVGSGSFALTISTSDAHQQKAPSEFDEFTAKGANREWSTLAAPDRIRRVGELAGRKAGSRLLAAYALIYSVSSEVVHGSPFGVNYFHQAHLPPGATVDDFKDSTARQVEDILSAVSHAVAGYLSAFFGGLHMAAPFREEQVVFNRLLESEGCEAQVVVDLP